MAGESENRYEDVETAAKDGAAAGAADTAINRLFVTFQNRDLEARYRTYLATEAFSRELFLQIIGIVAFFSYGFLDVLTVGDNAQEFLIVRWGIIGPLGAAGVALTSRREFRSKQQYSTIVGFAIYSLAIIYMIAKMPADGAPPYIIGVLVTMIFTSCLLRVNFMIAASTYLFVSAAYCASLAMRAEQTPIEIIAGNFFMISVTAVAVVTSYAQEFRSREIWLRNMQRERDAAQIRQLLVEATAADQSKLNFLSVLTHDLRTPLHQIIGFSELIRTNAEGRAQSAEAENIEQVLSSARALLKKIGQMLRYADATAGKLSFCMDLAPVKDVVDQIVDQHYGSAAKKSVSINAANVTPAMINIDLHHTTYALGNLLDNAVNASPPGAAIEIIGALLPDGRYAVTVRDEGGGMTAEQIAAAFEPFAHKGPVLSRGQEGLGLGLSIAKKLMERQNATLEIKSRPGAGSAVTVTGLNRIGLA